MKDSVIFGKRIHLVAVNGMVHFLDLLTLARKVLIHINMLKHVFHCDKSFKFENIDLTKFAFIIIFLLCEFDGK